VMALHWTHAVRRIALLMVDLPDVQRERLAMRLERSLEQPGTESERALQLDLSVFARDYWKERELERLWELAVRGLAADSADRMATQVDRLAKRLAGACEVLGGR